jgi:tetratricopeptide (TPR) repeat protein
MGEAPTQSGRRWQRDLALGAALVVAVVLAYRPAMSAGFIWDDPDYIVNNANLRDLQGLRATWFEPTSLPQYYPLVHTTFWLEFQAWGLWAPGYHVVNVLLHAANTVLLWLLLRRLALRGAWLAAALFALHPVQVESVAWITERKNVLSLLLALVTLACCIRGGLIMPSEPRRVIWRPWLGLALLAYAGALLSKSVTASLPAVVLLIGWWESGRVSWRDVRPLLPMFALGMAAGAFTVYLERSHVGAAGAGFDLAPAEKIIVAGRACWFYAGKLLWPYELSFIYPRWQIDAASIVQYLPAAAAVALPMTLLVLRSRIGRGPATAVLLFGGVLLPAVGLVSVFPMRYSFVADHFQYHAGIALLALAAAGVACLHRVGHLAACLLIALGVLTFRQSHIYRDALALWQDTASKNPRSWMVQENLAYALRDAGREGEAGQRFAAACQLAPELPDTHWAYARWLADAGRDDEALARLDEATRLDATFPGPYLTRGLILDRRGQSEQARDQFERAVQLHPTYAEAYFALGQLAERAGRSDDAIAEYSAAVSSRMGLAEAHYNLANLLQQAGRLDEALVHYTQAVSARPDWAEGHTNLGNTLLRMGRADQAIIAYTTALRLKPDLVPAQRGLRAARMRQPVGVQ